MRAPEWMSHLRTDRVGRPVPMVNRWGLEEKAAHVQVRYDRNVGGLAVFYEDSEETEPDFRIQNIGRQRQATLEGLCQICWRQVPWSRRFLVLSTVSTSVVTSQGPHRGARTVTEPWLCQRCAEFAIGVCPALIRRRAGDDLQLIKITSKRQVEILIGTGVIKGVPSTYEAPVALKASILVKDRTVLGG